MQFLRQEFFHFFLGAHRFVAVLVSVSFFLFIFFRTVSTKSLLLCLPNEHPVCLVSLRRQSRNSVEQITRLMPLSPRFHSKRGYFCLAVAAAAGVSNGIQLFRIAGLSNTGTERGTTRGRHS